MTYPGVRTRVTRYETEISGGWAKKNPELFVEAVDDFIEQAVQYDLYDVRMVIDRVGFITFIATKQEAT